MGLATSPNPSAELNITTHQILHRFAVRMQACVKEFDARLRFKRAPNVSHRPPTPAGRRKEGRLKYTNQSGGRSFVWSKLNQQKSHRRDHRPATETTFRQTMLVAIEKPKQTNTYDFAKERKQRACATLAPMARFDDQGSLISVSSNWYYDVIPVHTSIIPN